MKKFLIMAFCLCLISLFLVNTSFAATEQVKQAAIDAGLAWLAGHQLTSGSEGYWNYYTLGGGYDGSGNLGATASAALAFIEEGYLPGDGSIYDSVVTSACNYIFNRATVETRFGVETNGYWRYAEDYNNDGVKGNDGGNDQAIYFNPGVSTRNVYTTGLVAPVIYALGEALGPNTVVGMGSTAISGMTYKNAMRDVIDWFSWAQVEPNRGTNRGGWRYDANYTDADNSTAQWGALPILYGSPTAWNLPVPDYVEDELELWINHIQNPVDGDYRDGGSGYNVNTQYVNMAKTGGLLLELAAIGAPVTDPRVQAAIDFIENRWMNPAAYNGDIWYGGNLNNPYAMWAIYKALEIYGLTDTVESGGVDILIGKLISTAPGGYTIGQDWDPKTSAAGDWYSHYSQLLVDLQKADGSWDGYAYWTNAISAGWYINILNAKGAPPPVIPEPATMLLLLFGIGGIGIVRRKRRTK